MRWSTRILSLVGLAAVSIKTIVDGVGPETFWAFAACIYVAGDVWVVDGLRQKMLALKDERIALLETNTRFQGALLDASARLLKGDANGARPFLDNARDLAAKVEAMVAR